MAGKGKQGQPFEYVNHMDIRFDHLERIDVPALVEACTVDWYNQTLCQVNDSVVRLGVMKGRYHWHQHENEDELFFVLEGTFFVELEERDVELGPGQGLVVPRGVRHCPRSPEGSVVLMVETVGIVPTGS